MYRLIFILTALTIISCHSNNPNSLLSKSADNNDQLVMSEQVALHADLGIEPPRSAEPPAPPEEQVIDKGSKVIKRGHMKFEVRGLERIKRDIDATLKSVDAYYENEQFNAYSNRSSYSLSIRIPNGKFDSIINVFENGSVGSLVDKNITAKDVTEEYVDLNIRLENNLGYLAQYRSILEKAKSIEEILEVQEIIRKIEEEIDSKKGRLKFLDDRVLFSTLHLEITELNEMIVSSTPSFILRAGNAFMSGIAGFLNFTVAMIHVWPLLVCLFLLFIGRKKIFNLFRFRRVVAD